MHTKHARMGLGPDYTLSSLTGEKQVPWQLPCHCLLADQSASPPRIACRCEAHVEHAAVQTGPRFTCLLEDQ